MSTYEETSKIMSEVTRLRLIGMGRVTAFPIEDVSAMYNGTGPEFLPEKIRRKLDKIARPFLPAVMVHDVDFSLSDGTSRSFVIANQHLFWNCIRCALDAHPWTSWRRYALIVEAFVMYRACKRLGWIAWRLSYLSHK